MFIRRAVLTAVVVVLAVPAAASAQGISWGAGGNWYHGSYGQMFVGVSVLHADHGYYYVQSATIDGKVRNPCGGYQYVYLPSVQGEVHSLSPQQLSWTVTTTANSACQNGVSVPYPITISGTYRGEFYDNPCWISYNGVSDMTITWGGVTSSYLPTHNQYSNICRRGI